MLHPLLENLGTDVPLIPVVKHISQEKIDHFGIVAGGIGALHLDPEYGKTTRFKSTLAHGIAFTAFVSEMMENNFGLPWIENGRLTIKFVGPAKPGDTLLVCGKIKAIAPEPKKVVTCEFTVQNQRREKVAIGEACLQLSNSENKSGA